MPKDNIADLQKQMAQGRKKADLRQENENFFKDIDTILALERKNMGLPRPRPNRDFINGPGANEVMPFTGQTRRDARIDELSENVARKVNASRNAARNASGRPSNINPNGKFKGGSPRSSMSKNLKIK